MDGTSFLFWSARTALFETRGTQQSARADAQRRCKRDESHDTEIDARCFDALDFAKVELRALGKCRLRQASPFSPSANVGGDPDEHLFGHMPPVPCVYLQ